jgi:hypothetical protein
VKLIARQESIGALRVSSADVSARWRAELSFHCLCAHEDSLCDQPLCERDRTTPWRARQAARRSGYTVSDDYPIAGITTYPWILPYERLRQDLNDFPNLKRRFDEIAARTATVRTYAWADRIKDRPMPARRSAADCSAKNQQRFKILPVEDWETGRL